MRGAAILLLASFISSASFGLEIEEGDLRLRLDEPTSRFTVVVEQNGRWLNLLFPEDLRTSATEVLENNQVHRLGDSGRFSQRIEQGTFGPRFVWESSTLLITQSFELTRSTDSLVANAVQIRTTIASTAEEPREVGVRFLLDTWLGERGNHHFALPDGRVVDGELRLDPASTPFVVSKSAESSTTGLQVMLGTASVTPPEAVYLTNWQRASDSAWEYQYNPTRNFNRLPFSINDSAILVRYPTEVISTGQEYEVVARLGDLAPAGYMNPALAFADRRMSTGSDASADERDPSDPALIERLSELIQEIAALSTEDEIEMAEILRLQQELQELGELIRGR